MSIATVTAQNVLTPEKLWEIGRVSPLGISKDGKNILYKVATPSAKENKSTSKTYALPINGGTAIEVSDIKAFLHDKNVSPDGKYILKHQEVKLEKILGSDFHPELKQSNVQIYNGLNYRHWDTWNEGKHHHVGYSEMGNETSFIDVMEGEPFDAPQKPFGGDEDYVWSKDGKSIIYVCKKKSGTAYATSTNTDLYEYHLDTKSTKNLTENNLGYDTHPTISPNGDLSWLQMKREGYEADKNDIIVRVNGLPINLTAQWDGTVDSFMWSNDGKKIYFLAPTGGTKQLFEVNFPGPTKIAITVRQLTQGDFDVTDIVGFSGDKLIVGRTDMNHAKEIFSYDLKKKNWLQLTHVNDSLFNSMALPTIQKRYVSTTDGKQMLVGYCFPPILILPKNTQRCCIAKVAHKVH